MYNDCPSLRTERYRCCYIFFWSVASAVLVLVYILMCFAYRVCELLYIIDKLLITIYLSNYVYFAKTVKSLWVQPT